VLRRALSGPAAKIGFFHSQAGAPRLGGWAKTFGRVWASMNLRAGTRPGVMITVIGGNKQTKGKREERRKPPSNTSAAKEL